MSEPRPGQSPVLLSSPEEVTQTLNAIDELEKRTQRLKLTRDKYPFHIDIQDLHNCMNFHLNILKLAPQSGKTYHARQIGLGAGGAGLDERKCKGLYFSAMGFLFDIVNSRFFLDEGDEPEFMADIQKHHDNRCFVTDILLTGELVKGPPSPSEQPKSNSENSPRIMPLIPEFADEENCSNFWNFASKLLGHPEWVEQYVNPENIDKDPRKYLLLQKSVATEFSRFKFAVGAPTNGFPVKIGNELGYEPTRPEDYDSGSDAESFRGDSVIDVQCSKMRKEDEDIARYDRNHGKVIPVSYMAALDAKMREWEEADNDVSVMKDGELLARLEKEYDALEILVRAEDAEAKVRAEAEEEGLKEQDRAGKWE